MIFLFTDFGTLGPYNGQVRAALMRSAPAVPVIDLFLDAPTFDPRLSAYLLAAYAESFMPGDVFLCVVDPEVGTSRRPLVVYADGRWFVGPDNGLFELIRRRSRDVYVWVIEWKPTNLSATFHARDLFAPVAARLARGEASTGVQLAPDAIARPNWPDELQRIVYIDTYGNAMTGMRAKTLSRNTILEVNGRPIRRGRTFADVPTGACLWYANSNGLAEIAINQGRAAEALGLQLGSQIEVGTG